MRKASCGSGVMGAICGSGVTAHGAVMVIAVAVVAGFLLVALTLGRSEGAQPAATAVRDLGVAAVGGAVLRTMPTTAPRLPSWKRPSRGASVPLREGSRR